MKTKKEKREYCQWHETMETPAECSMKPTITTQAKHTPTPWFRNIKANGKYPTIYAGRNQHTCTVSQQSTGEETEANIDFIVRAVNSHEVLLEAAKNARNVLAGLAMGHLKEVKANSPALQQLRDAIAQAEGL